MNRIGIAEFFHHGMDGADAAIKSAAQITVTRANTLLDRLAAAGVSLETNDRGSMVNSGYRPAAINATIPNAAKRSKHMLGQAIDISDPDGVVDDWCMNNLDVLEEVGIWLEHPSATKGWAHWQIVPPGSGNRCFYP